MARASSSPGSTRFNRIFISSAETAPASNPARFSAMRITVAAGLNRSDLAEVRQLGLAEAIAALEAGEVDVLFAVEAVPSLPLQALPQRRRDTRFLDIDPSGVAELTERQKLLLEQPAGAHWFFPSLFEEREQKDAAD